MSLLFEPGQVRAFTSVRKKMSGSLAHVRHAWEEGSSSAEGELGKGQFNIHIIRCYGCRLAVLANTRRGLRGFVGFRIVRRRDRRKAHWRC